MPEIKFQSVDKAARTATFSVDGVAVVRHIPNTFEGGIDAYLTALASGLAVEYAPPTVQVIDTPSLASGAVVVAAGAPVAGG